MFCARLFICALWSPAGKGLTSWLSFVVSSVSLSLSHWYPGSGVVLDCIDSWSLQPYYFVNITLQTKFKLTYSYDAVFPNNQLTTFQLCFLSLIVLLSLYLHVQAPLSQRLNVIYHNRWMLQRKSPPKLPAGFESNFAGIILIWRSSIIGIILLVRCISRSYGLK